MSRGIGRPILLVATAVVVVSIIAGVVVIGSPGEGRLQQLDAGRIADLRGIMGATDRFWARTDRLPASLDELAADARTSVTTADPGTGEAYAYRVLDGDSYELCATFDRASIESPGRSTEAFWRHGSGRQCFELEVDKTVRER